MSKISFYDDMKVLINIIINEGLLKGAFSILKHFLPNPIYGFISLIEVEIENGFSTKLTIKQRIDAIKKGFTTNEYFYYGIQNGANPQLYLSEFQRLAYTKNINKNPEILDNKIFFYDYMARKGFIKYLPTLFGFIKNGKYIDIESVKYNFEKRKKIVIKPVIGGSGKRILLCEKHKDKILINGKKIELKDFGSIFDVNQDYLVTEYCNQANFLSNIYPISANTMRIYTMTPNGEKAFIPNAFLKIGTKKSGITDNAGQGGLFAQINLENGNLSAAAEIFSSEEIKWHEYHPETNSKIKGFNIPEWNIFKKRFLSFVNELTEVKYVGWDVLLTGDNKDFIIIEGNSHPMINLTQIYRPLLKSPRIRNFYRENGVPV